MDTPGSFGYFYYLCRLKCTAPAQSHKKTCSRLAFMTFMGGDMRQRYKALLHLEVDASEPVFDAISRDAEPRPRVPRSR